MSERTYKQKRQQALSWKLKIVTGAMGNLNPHRDHYLPPEICLDLGSIVRQLKRIEEDIRSELRNIK